MNDMTDEMREKYCLRIVYNHDIQDRKITVYSTPEKVCLGRLKHSRT